MKVREFTASWLQQWDNEGISDEVRADRIGEMVASRDGPRGFFVVSLAGDSALMDRMPHAVVGQLLGADAGVADALEMSCNRPARSGSAAAALNCSGCWNQRR